MSTVMWPISPALPCGPAVEAAAEDQPRAHARAQDDGHDRVVRPVALGEELGQGQAVGVVLDDDGDIELGPQEADEPRLFVERRVRGAVHDVVGRVIGAGSAHADGLDAGGARRFVDELQDIGDDPLPALFRLGRPALAGQDGPRLVDQAGLDLGPAEVDTDGVALDPCHSTAILCETAGGRQPHRRQTPPRIPRGIRIRGGICYIDGH
jgi:hypothetical protein